MFMVDDLLFSCGNNKTTALLKSKQCSGWVSEIYERNGVITFLGTNNEDDRVYFSADKLFLYEKKFNSKQALTGLLTIGTIHELQNVKFRPLILMHIYYKTFRVFFFSLFCLAIKDYKNHSL